MDPLHPFVPIQPPPPPAPTYGRVERIERDGQHQPAPDWEQNPEQDSEENPAQEEFEDEYDPDWSNPGAAEPYGPDGAHHDAAPHDAIEIDLSAETNWDPRTHPDRRSRPRDQDEGIDPDAGHIDISA
jgi:hypothetical protein